MGLLSLFTRGPLSEEKIAKIAKLAANPFAQPDVRMREMERLLEDGSEAALRGLLRRFACNAQGHIADEDEKKWLEDALVKVGDAALPPLQDYIHSETKLTYALRSYSRIAGSQAAAQFFMEVLERYGPEDYRSDEAKLQLVLQLGDAARDPAVMARLLPFLRDHSDDVCWAVLDLLQTAEQTHAGSDPALQEVLKTALPALLHLLTHADSSARVARQCAEVLVVCGWALPEGAVMIHPMLEEDFFLDKKRYVRRRVKK